VQKNVPSQLHTLSDFGSSVAEYVGIAGRYKISLDTRRTVTRLLHSLELVVLADYISGVRAGSIVRMPLVNVLHIGDQRFYMRTAEPVFANERILTFGCVLNMYSIENKWRIQHTEPRAAIDANNDAKTRSIRLV
jgi:hypothetical protein